MISKEIPVNPFEYITASVLPDWVKVFYEFTVDQIKVPQPYHRLCSRTNEGFVSIFRTKTLGLTTDFSPYYQTYCRYCYASEFTGFGELGQLKKDWDGVQKNLDNGKIRKRYLKWLEFFIKHMIYDHGWIPPVQCEPNGIDKFFFNLSKIKRKQEFLKRYDKFYCRDGKKL